MARKLLVGLVLAAAGGCALTADNVCRNIILPEQRTIDVRDPAQFPAAPIPPSVPPRTVTHPRPETAEWQLSLDDAIRIALENSTVVRILAGTAATASGNTIYDVAITNTTIDQAQAAFDPVLKWNNTWGRTNTPFAVLDFLNPTRSAITSNPTDTYTGDLGLSQTNLLGGKWAVDLNDNYSRIAANGPFPLNPQNQSNVTLSYTQPLLQGAGFAVNSAPIVIARLNTEQSFFQYKDSVQELVRGVIDAYWSLVQARVNVWARKIQEQQSKEAYDRESARLQTGFSDVGIVSQARVTYNQFRASRIAAEADVLTREGTLRNLMYLPPNDNRQLVPTSAPAVQRFVHEWERLVRLAEQRRPDIVELKIILEADQVRLVQAENQALPRLDAVALYRWNGVSGEMPNEEFIETGAGKYTDWAVSVNFSVPLGLRQGRAQARQQMFLIARDRANIEQQVHLAVHQLASTLQDLDGAYEQYLAFKETRAAADVNLRVQLEKFRTGQTIYLSVLQALNDWGSAVSSEAQQLLLYNVALANLERQTGTILETHGLVFAEERLRAAGPLLGHDRDYPAAVTPVGAPTLYPATPEPAEESFDLRNPVQRGPKPAEMAPPAPKPPKPMP